MALPQTLVATRGARPPRRLRERGRSQSCEAVDAALQRYPIAAERYLRSMDPNPR
jgi:hypothetical protein